MKVKRAELEQMINGLSYVYHTIKNDSILAERISGFAVGHILDARNFLEAIWSEFPRRSTAEFEAETITFGEQYNTVEYKHKPGES